MCAAVPQLGHHELGLIDANRGERPQVIGVGRIHERGEHVPDRDRVQRRGHEDSERRLRRELPHRVLGSERVREHFGKGSVVADRAGEHERHALGHQSMHDP